MQFLITITDNVPVGNPISLSNLCQTDEAFAAIGNTYVTPSQAEALGYGIFERTDVPFNTDLTKHYVEGTPTEKSAEGHWLQRWELVSIEFSTTAEYAAKVEETKVLLAVLAREKRTSLLSATDWRFRSDMTPSQAWIGYCQLLRDVPNQEGFPDAIDWPEKPEEED